jgi:growth factor-regulated tyrosine kinase substrate
MYGLPPNMPRPASSLYPSFQQSGPESQTGESFYTGNAAPSDSYAKPPAYYGGYQSTPQQAPAMYAQYDKRASMPPQYTAPLQQPSQPYPNLGSYNAGTAPQQRPPSTIYQPQSSAPDASPQLQRRVSNQQYPSQPPQTYPQAPPSTVSDAESSSFYYGESNAAQTSAPPAQPSQPFAPQPTQAPQPSSPEMYNRAPPQQTPISPLTQPAPFPQNQFPPQQQAPPNGYWQQQQPDPAQAPQPAPPSQQSWQQPNAKQTPAQAAWQPAPYAMGGYGPESFPSAPQHQIQQPVVDEPLIDL